MGEAKRRRLAAEAAKSFADVYRQWPEAAAPDFARGGLTIMSVEHDADCPGLGTGVGCTCKPNVRFFSKPTEQ
jgi:hypothetical protein